MASFAEAFSFSRETTAIWTPVSIGEQLYHWLLRRADCRTFVPQAPAADQVRALEAATLPAGFLQPPPDLAAALARFGIDTPPET